MSRIRFMNTKIDNLTMKESVDKIEELIKNKQQSYVVTPNVDHIVKLEKDNKLKEVYDHADLVLCDGKPLVWISQMYGNPIKEKVSGSDLFPHLCEMSAEKGYKMFFLGAKEGVAAKAAENLKERFKGLDVVGTYSPPLGFENDDDEIKKIVAQVQESKPDMLMVCLGCPKQEYFVHDHYKELGVPVSLGLGATIDFAADEVSRAPKWMSNNGLEWLYRLIQEPKRMFKRYIVEDSKMVQLIMKYRPKKLRKRRKKMVH